MNTSTLKDIHSTSQHDTTHFSYDLTKFAKPGTPVKPYDGLCGNVVQNVLVTSPNMRFLYEPPLGECRVRLRKDWHFGRDDPLYYPQPFNIKAPHLSVLRVPPPDSRQESPDIFSAAWIVPDESHFVPSGDTLCEGFGTLQSSLVLQLTNLNEKVIKTMPEGYGGDVHLRACASQLCATTLRLELAAPKEEVFLRFRCAQRYVLELDARIRWLARYDEKFENYPLEAFRASCHGEVAPGDPSIMGAFTEEVDVAGRLSYCRIPAYFLRHLSRSGDVRIDEVVPFIKESSSLDHYLGQAQKIRLHNGTVVDVSDAKPSHRVVFTGLVRNPKRYLSMANYINTFLDYPSYLGSEQPRHSTSFGRVSSKARMPIRRAPARAQNVKSKTPYFSGKRNKGDQGHNSFLPFLSPLMPTYLDTWKDALGRLYGYNQSLPPPDGVSRGYALPPGEMFITPSNASTTIALFANWLRLRQLLIYRLSIASNRFSKKQWKDMLTIGHGASEAHSDTRTSQRRRESLSLLSAMMNNSPLNLQLEALSSAPTYWRGRRMDPEQLPPTDYAKEILWELHELNFRQDMVALDRHLDRSGMDTLQRASLLNACWNGTRDYADLVKPNEGFACIFAEGRWPYVKALHQLMSTWTGPKPLILLTAFPEDLIHGSHNLETILKGIETELANYYTQSFLDVFGRAASIPFRLFLA